MKTALIVIVVGAVACGGRPPPGSSTEPDESVRGSQPHAAGRALPGAGAMGSDAMGSDGGSGAMGSGAMGSGAMGSGSMGSGAMGSGSMGSGSMGSGSMGAMGTGAMGAMGSGAMAEGEHGEAAMPPVVKAFHDTLAPRWHAAHGAQRKNDTCAAKPQLDRQAAAIVAAPAPGGADADAAAWTRSGNQLTEALSGLARACRGTDMAGFEKSFEGVHVAFHHVLEASSGPEHGEHERGEHEHGERSPGK